MSNDKLKSKQQNASRSAKNSMSAGSSAFDPDEKTLFFADDDDFDVETIDIDNTLEDFEDILEKEVRNTLDNDLDDEFIDDLENHFTRELEKDSRDDFDDFDDFDDLFDEDFLDTFSYKSMPVYRKTEDDNPVDSAVSPYEEAISGSEPVTSPDEKAVSEPEPIPESEPAASPAAEPIPEPEPAVSPAAEPIPEPEPAVSPAAVPIPEPEPAVSEAAVTGSGNSADVSPEADASLSAESSALQDSGTQKRSSVPYVIIGALSVSLAALGAVTFMSLNRLVSLQSRVSLLQQAVVDISDSASALSQKAEELKNLQEEEAAESAKEEASVQSGEVQGPQKPAIPEEDLEEQGTLSPSKGNTTFTNNTDESMDSLLVQIEPLLPQDNGSWSVYVCNLNKGSEGIIGGGSMQAASLIKLYIMGTVYENYEALVNTYGKDSLDSNLKAMITVSDNDAANTLVNWLGSGDNANGMEMVNNFCQAHGYTETSMGRLLLHSKENGDNYTSVRDCGRFLKEIYEINKGTSANSTLSHADAMFALLKQQQRVNKIPADLPEGVHVANKTGELSDVENDAGIIYDTPQGIDLVVCFMSENLNDTISAQDNIAMNSRMIYGYYNE